jgi:hypothetical protein
MKPRSHGRQVGTAQERRRTRRAAARRTSMTAAATGATNLPLSDRGRAWDASGADKRVRSWAGASDAPNAKYGRAFFWKDSSGGDSFGDYKLGFADVVGGTLTAIFRGVTAVAGVLQGARGGVQGVSDAEKASIRTKVEGYYRKAAKQYDDDSIKPPWKADSASEADMETFASLVESFELDAEQLGWAKALAYAETLDDAVEEYADRLVFWAEAFGGKPSRGTKADRRLRENKPGDDKERQPEDLALERLDAFQHGLPCTCAHPLSEHKGAQGACTHSDGRGVCRCGAFAEAQTDESQQATALSAEQEAELRELVAAIGDIALGPGDGFVDLLCDVNEILSGRGGAYDYDEVGYGGPRAIDAGVRLDKVLICDYSADGGYYVAPITIGSNGEPTLAERDEWVPVEQGWVETPGENANAASARMRFTLREFAMVEARPGVDGATTPPVPDEHQPQERTPRRSSRITDPTPPAGSGTRPSYEWDAVFVPEATLTEDGRAFAPGSLSWRDLPLTLMAMTTTGPGGHEGARLAGRIDRIWREGELVKAAGVFDSGPDDSGAFGEEIARLVGDGTLRGLSVDIAPLEWDRTPRDDWFDENGAWIATQDEDGNWVPAGAAERSEEDAIAMLFGEGPNLITVVTKAVIGMATVCPFPAFGKASISLLASGAFRFEHQGRFVVVEGVYCESCGEATETTEVGEEGGELTAAAAGLVPVAPPSEWFADPELEELTPLTITDDGRIYGHAWGWDTCHLAFDQCVLAPHSKTEYAYFHLGELVCADEEAVAVGKVTMDTGHAGQKLTRAAAIRHYDDTGTVVAHICVGEDDHGGWFAGAIDPDLSAEKLRLLRASTLSGDWRGVNGNLELVALLAVNVPGFPVPRPRYSAVSGETGPEVVALTAAGIVLEGISPEQDAELRELAAQAREAA